MAPMTRARASSTRPQVLHYGGHGMLVYPPLAEATTPTGKGFRQRIPVVAEMRSRGQRGLDPD